MFVLMTTVWVVWLGLSALCLFLSHMISSILFDVFDELDEIGAQDVVATGEQKHHRVA